MLDVLVQGRVQRDGFTRKAWRVGRNHTRRERILSMTTIVAQEFEDKVLIAFDDKVSGADTSTTVEKVYTNESADIVLGVSGLLSVSQTLRYAKLPRMKDDDWDVDRYVTRKLIPALNRAADEDLEMCSVLAVVRGRVYEIDGNCWTRNGSGDYAIGSGGKYALGALAAGAPLHEAVQIAGDLDPHTSTNVTVMEC